MPNMPNTGRPVQPDREKIQEVVKTNYEAFTRMLPDLLKTHPGQFALMRDGEIADFFPSARKASQHGETAFDDGLFSVQEVTDEVVDLGWFSHVEG